MAQLARWLFPKLDRDGVETLARALGVGIPAATVLYGRGLCDEASARRVLCPSLEDLHDPLALRTMDCVLERLTRAIQCLDKYLIYDKNVDDVTLASRILKGANELEGRRTDFCVQDRLTDGYVMRPDVVDLAEARGISLIISVDTGIRAAQVVCRAS